MRKYFINPELKISSGILLIIMALFLFITSYCLKLNHDSLKENYIKSIGAVTARVVAKDPSLEKDIVPLITKEISSDDAAKGAEILNKYGMNKELEVNFFPYLSKTVVKDTLSITIIFIMMSAVLFAVNYFQYGFFYEKFRNLTAAAKKIVEGNYDLIINENKEGDLSKLAVSFNSMKEVIRNNISELKKEKQFLVDILSDISHQLKTPLSSMMVYNEIMLTKELSQEQKEKFLLNDKNQLHRMKWLIQSILKLAKLDAKAIVFDKQDQSLNETMFEAIDALERKAQDQQIKINYKDGTEINFYHDRLWLEEAFMNIIKNGIEHTCSGGKIDIELVENPIYRRVIIEDNGEGIREEDLPNIFKRFYKVKTSRKNESVGIGLALAKSIVEAHNGVIDVNSKVGVGTRFVITFLKY